MSRNPKFDALLEEIAALHSSKNHDYAHDGDPLSNLRRCEAFGVPPVTGVLVRLSDKWSRIEELTRGKTPKHESLRDSLMDNAIYSLLAIVLLDEQAQQARDDQIMAMGCVSAFSPATVAYVGDVMGVPANVP